jgi:hypothetical protein
MVISRATAAWHYNFRLRAGSAGGGLAHGRGQRDAGCTQGDLWELTIGKQRYGVLMDDDWGTEPRIAAGKVRLRDVLKPRKTIIDYTYDFGDGWEHRLTVIDVRAGQPGVSYPRYIGGERNGPPEDCGGIPGFYELLEAITDPTHPSHAHLKEWAGDYDPITLDALPIKYALGRIANRRNAAKARLAKKKHFGSAA